MNSFCHVCLILDVIAVHGCNEGTHAVFSSQILTFCFCPPYLVEEAVLLTDAHSYVVFLSHFVNSLLDQWIARQNVEEGILHQIPARIAIVSYDRRYAQICHGMGVAAKLVVLAVKTFE